MKTDSTEITWRVQYRRNRDRGWRNGPRYETREDARRQCAVERAMFGFGNTRVQRVVKGK